MNVSQINNLTFWWSILSSLVNLILLIVSVALAVYTWRETQNKKGQVKIWMNDANGVQQSLQRIIIDNLQRRYTTTNDMANAVWAVQSMAFSLYESLFEERVIKEKDFIKEQQALRKELLQTAKKQRATAARQARSQQTPPPTPESTSN